MLLLDVKFLSCIYSIFLFFSLQKIVTSYELATIPTLLLLAYSRCSCFGHISDFGLGCLQAQWPTEQQEGKDSFQDFPLGTFASSTLCPHRSDHLRHRRGMGCTGRAGSHRHSPCQGPRLLCGWVRQPLQSGSQGHPEHLYRVQLTASELNSEQAKHQQMPLSRLALGQSPMLYGTHVGQQGT